MVFHPLRDPKLLSEGRRLTRNTLESQGKSTVLAPPHRNVKSTSLPVTTDNFIAPNTIKTYGLVLFFSEFESVTYRQNKAHFIDSGWLTWKCPDP